MYVYVRSHYYKEHISQDLPVFQVHVTDTEDDKWRKSCFKTDLFISWIKLENLPADNHVDDMHIRRVIMKACTE